MTRGTFELTPRGSFSWPAAFTVLTRFCPLGHVWEGDERQVRLSLLADGDLAPVMVDLAFDRGALRGRLSDRARTDVVARQVARIFSLDHDGTGWDELPIASLVPGLRPICFASPYEAGCWAILSQRIAKTQAARIVRRLVDDHGHFPTPEELVRIASIPGVPAIKIERLHAVAAAARDGVLDAERLRALGDDAGPASLRAIPGIGAFWSSGIYLRACGIRDVFPHEPLSVAALARWAGLRASPSEDQVQRAAEPFRPFRMWACFALRVASAQAMAA